MNKEKKNNNVIGIILGVSLLIVSSVYLIYNLIISDENQNNKGNNTIQIKTEYNNILVKETKEFKKIKLEDIDVIEIVSTSTEGRETSVISEETQINDTYKLIGNIKIENETSERLDNNSIVYRFQMKNNKKYEFSFEGNNIIINNKAYTTSSTLNNID